MIAFFDTNIYIDYLKGTFPQETYQDYFQKYVIRLCPVVYQELVRGIRSEKVRKKVEAITKRILFLPPPSNAMWIKTGQLAAKVMKSFDAISLEKIQNDLLIALTAYEHGAILITQDRHFQMIQKHLSFKLDFFDSK
ncbi:MAG: PIN domain-containing protein [Deltaproteobacteria bacterium]|nr:MAG: PIN domain-containing protein [Deltaproteobacteria bacterium]